MPELQNPQHEAFVKAFAPTGATGDDAINAYLSAGYKCKSRPVAHAAACRLLKLQQVVNRLAELRENYRAIAAKQEAEKHKVVESVVTYEIRTAIGRAIALCDRRLGLLEVIRQRATFEEHQWAPGGNTGYVVTSWKAVGKDAYRTHEVDIALLRELRETEKQIAIEMGQWSEKSEHKMVWDGDPNKLTDEQFAKFREVVDRQALIAFGGDPAKLQEHKRMVLSDNPSAEVTQ